MSKFNLSDWIFNSSIWCVQSKSFDVWCQLFSIRLPVSLLSNSDVIVTIVMVTHCFEGILTITTKIRDCLTNGAHCTFLYKWSYCDEFISWLMWRNFKQWMKTQQDKIRQNTCQILHWADKTGFLSILHLSVKEK